MFEKLILRWDVLDSNPYEFYSGYLSSLDIWLFKILLYLSGRNESGANKNSESEKAFVKAKEYVCCRNKDYVKGGNPARCR